MQKNQVLVLAGSNDCTDEDSGDRAPSSAPQRIDPTFRTSSRAALAVAMGHFEVPALLAADELYGAEIESELSDIRAGKHPLQRGGKGLDAHIRIASELADIRAALQG